MPSPIAHSLMGYCLYTDGSERRRPQWSTLALFVFLGNAPDLDFLPGIAHGNVEFYHRAITHSVAFAALASAIVFLVLKVLRSVNAGRLGRIVLLALLSHIALDYFCAGHPSEGVAVLWPFSDMRLSSSINLFPPLTSYPILGWTNLQAVLVEMSILMILMQISELFRFLGRAQRRLRARRAEAQTANSDLGAAAE